MAKKQLIEQYCDAFAYAAADMALVPAERAEAAAKATSFALLAIAIRGGDYTEILAAEAAACATLAFMLIGVEDPRLLARLQEIADLIVEQRNLLIDMKTFAEGNDNA